MICLNQYGKKVAICEMCKRTLAEKSRWSKGTWILSKSVVSLDGITQCLNSQTEIKIIPKKTFCSPHCKEDWEDLNAS